MSCLRHLHLLRWLLILGLLLGSTSVSIRHAHERHGLDHPSGFARQPSSIEEVGSPHLWHTHLLLLGVECCEWEGAFFPPGMTVGIGVDVPDPSVARAILMDTPDSALAAQPGTTWLIDEPLAFIAPCTSVMFNRVLLCDQARGARSGVRLT
ncbi:MAG: hypothetical protein U0840_19720 [Gemmataceae bacterium]